jgi:RNA polymerase sigma-70 factor, ECF subfamily
MSNTAQIAEPRTRNIAYRPEFGRRAPLLKIKKRPTRSEVHASDAADQATFDIMVRTYSADLLRFAYWLCRNRWQAQDLVQETLVSAWKGRDSLRDRSAIKPWLFSILRNEHIRVFQKSRPERSDIELEGIDIADNGGELERVELENSLSALPEQFREPLLLHVLGGFSGREIAAMLNISEPNVMTRLKRARDALSKLAVPQSAAPPMACG